MASLKDLYKQRRLELGLSVFDYRLKRWAYFASEQEDTVAVAHQYREKAAWSSRNIVELDLITGDLTLLKGEYLLNIEWPTWVSPLYHEELK